MTPTAISRRSSTLNSGRFADARHFADEAYSTGPNAMTRSLALMARGLTNLYDGHTAEAVRDHAEATALARELPDDPAFLAGALVYEAQALTAAGLLARAAALLDQARTVGAPVDATALDFLDTLTADLALADGQPADALEPYARSLEGALARGSVMQITNDLVCLAEALAALGHEAESLELAGMAESHGAEIGAVPDTLLDHVAAVEQRLGPARTAALKERGHAVPSAERVGRACRIARSHTPAHAVAGD